ncbi:hypothetical protein AXF42_Ash008399 [Apostasia shenzhenica]|uniref:BPL/LPL catalytic domain-containing protein n=1 Tax=Apostasia shenzhenica TaxID=1088818 RepID=A0A2I0AXR2_9ASPA|nr:hypothetical protein AXF42_Ash008399 [Apostasia shenzhenica]
MNLIRTGAFPILRQLYLEERLLRTSSNNWCLINDGTSHPNLVMGVSGIPVELINIDLVLQDQIPIIRRFTGGGTVIVDDGTIFVTFICNKDAIPGLQPYPRPIMSWTGQFYEKVFQGFAGFHLCENDYAFENRKFGGNALSITKNRWIHHTSFLWDYDGKNMEYLKIPKRAPEFRLVWSFNFGFIEHLNGWFGICLHKAKVRILVNPKFRAELRLIPIGLEQAFPFEQFLLNFQNLTKLQNSLWFD